MAEDKFKAQARAVIEGCPFNLEQAIADDLREADAENQSLRRDLSWALETLAQHVDSPELQQQIRQKQKMLAQKNEQTL
jgi:hypothetical protein